MKSFNYKRYIKAQKTTPLQVSHNDVHNVFSNFIKGGSGSPQFVTDKNGKPHLFIHGSPPYHGVVYFYIGEGQQFGDNPPGYVKQTDLDEWMQQQGYGAGTSVISCYSGQAGSDINSEFGNSGEIGVSAPADGSGDTLEIQN